MEELLYESRPYICFLFAFLGLFAIPYYPATIVLSGILVACGSFILASRKKARSIR